MLGCPFPGSLAKKSRLCLDFFVSLPNFLSRLPGFFKLEIIKRIYQRIYKAKKETQGTNLPPCHFLDPKVPS